MTVRTTYQAPSAEIQRAIHDELGCGSSFVGAVPVIDAGPDVQRLVMVSVMSLIGHATAKHAFAWWNVPGVGSTALALVVSGDGVEDAEAAVRAWAAGVRPGGAPPTDVGLPSPTELAPPA